MNYDDFIESLSSDKPPAGLNPWLTALWHARKGDWDRAHRIVQELPDRKAARIHAYLHRVEGDHWNSRYWHERAGTRFPEHLSLEEEWEQLVHLALESQGHVRCPPWRAKRRRVVPGSREATRDTRRAEGAKGDPKGASERGVQSYGRPVCSRNELAMLWRNAG